MSAYSKAFAIYCSLGFGFLSSVALAAATVKPIVIDRLEASVNSSLVLKSDIDQFRRIERLRAQMDPLYSGTSIASKKGQASDQEITDFLINERLISQLFPIADSEVEQEINAIQTNNHIDRSTLKAAIAQQGFGFEEYFELIRLSTSKRYLIDREIRTKVNITDSDIKNYFYNHYTKSSDADRSYKLKIIVINTKHYKTSMAAKDVAMRAREALKNGELFEEVAKRFSNDASANAGGDLGTLTEDQMSPAIRKQLKGMKIGEVSDIFGNPSAAYYILKLEDVTSDETGRLEKMKEEIRNQLLATEYQHQIQLWIDRQRQNAFIHRAGEPSINQLPIQP